MDAFVTLGMPRAVANDEFLHALLFGDQPLVNEPLIRNAYAISATQVITGPALLYNPRMIVQETGSERATAFRGLVNEYLDAISAHTHVEEPDYLTSTRRALDMTMRIARLEDAPPVTPVPGTEKVYLPVINK